jgi:predicted transcriptional regulator
VKVQLDDPTTHRLRLLALRLGLSAEDVAQYAVADFLARHEGG